jgi:hypothetical protein
MQPFNLNDLPTYVGACDALVLPHYGIHASGSIESACIFLSQERLVITPDLPRFNGLFPSHTNVPYIPGSKESLAEAMVQAQNMARTLSPKDFAPLDVHKSWETYTRQLLRIYHQQLGGHVEEE